MVAYMLTMTVHGSHVNAKTSTPVHLRRDAAASKYLDYICFINCMRFRDVPF